MSNISEQSSTHKKNVFTVANFKNFTVEIHLSLIYENFCQIMNFLYKEL